MTLVFSMAYYSQLGLSAILLSRQKTGGIGREDNDTADDRLGDSQRQEGRRTA